MAVDPVDAVEIQDIERIEAATAGRRDALAQKFGEGSATMKAPGDPYVMLVVKGKLRSIKVTYLTGGGA